jgi:RNA polymerase sigma factor (sigma-70 family)
MGATHSEAWVVRWGAAVGRTGRIQRPGRLGRPRPRSVRNTDTTQLLVAAREGDRASFDALFARVYDELRAIARDRIRGHFPGAPLDPTGLVHEAYLKLVDPVVAGANDRAHFLALASRAMRFILIDHARAQRVQKRGGGQPALSLGPVPAGTTGPGAAGSVEAGGAAAAESVVDLLTLDRALSELRSRSERQSQLVEYRFFGGLSYEEISEVTGLSVRTVKRDWTCARAWLYTFMQGARS